MGDPEIASCPPSGVMLLGANESDVLSVLL
jgi:hypothetical protein